MINDLQTEITLNCEWNTGINCIVTQANKSFLSYLVSLVSKGVLSKCEISLICMRMHLKAELIFIFVVSHRLVLTRRQKATRKWLVDDFFPYASHVICLFFFFVIGHIFNSKSFHYIGIVTDFLLLLPTEASYRFRGVIFLSLV